MKNEKSTTSRHPRQSYGNSKKKANNWTSAEDTILVEMAKRNNFRNWAKVASAIKGRSAIQCSARYKRIQPGLVKGAWTKEEDEQLLELEHQFGRNWCNIAKQMPTRTGKQIRDRFLNALDPNLKKAKFTAIEDTQILELYKIHGKSWCLIAKNMPGRTGDMVKNRFYSSLKKQFEEDEEIIEEEKHINRKRKRTKDNSKKTTIQSRSQGKKKIKEITPKKSPGQIKKITIIEENKEKEIKKDKVKINSAFVKNKEENIIISNKHQSSMIQGSSVKNNFEGLLYSNNNKNVLHPTIQYDLLPIKNSMNYYENNNSLLQKVNAEPPKLAGSNSSFTVMPNNQDILFYNNLVRICQRENQKSGDFKRLLNETINQQASPENLESQLKILLDVQKSLEKKKSLINKQ